MQVGHGLHEAGMEFAEADGLFRGGAAFPDGRLDFAFHRQNWSWPSLV